MESFFKYAKHEQFSRKSYQSIDQVRLAAFEYIEGFNNTLRPHSANNMLSPNQVEHNFSLGK